MANTTVIIDRYAEAALKSMADFLAADLLVAWGSPGVEIVLGTPDLDFDHRMKADGTREKRDLAVRPFVVLTPRDVRTGAWAISPRNDNVERGMAVRVDVMAADHFKLLNLMSTLQSVLDGAKSSTGGFDIKDPDPPNAVSGVAYFDPNPNSAVLSGPGDIGEEGRAFPTGKAQYDNLKHRASMLVTFSVAKKRGSKVI